MAREWVIIDDTVVSFSTAGAVSDEVWNEFVSGWADQPIKRFLGVHVGRIERSREQRQQVMELWRDKELIVAVVTDDSLFRNAVTAASWMGFNIKAFPLAHLAEAIQSLAASQEVNADISRWLEPHMAALNL